MNNILPLQFNTIYLLFILQVANLDSDVTAPNDDAKLNLGPHIIPNRPVDSEDDDVRYMNVN